MQRTLKSLQSRTQALVTSGALFWVYYYCFLWCWLQSSEGITTQRRGLVGGPGLMPTLDCLSPRGHSFLGRSCSVAQQLPSPQLLVRLQANALVLSGGFYRPTPGTAPGVPLPLGRFIPQLAADCSEQCSCGHGPALLRTEDLRAS